MFSDLQHDSMTFLLLKIFLTVLNNFLFFKWRLKMNGKMELTLFPSVQSHLLSTHSAD